jgi:hypothetical protein
MNTPFIRNHQYNFIKKQTDFLLKTLRTVADRRVLETIRYRSSLNVVEAFSTLSDSQQQLLQQISTFETAYDFQKYLSGLEPYLEPFPQITPKQIQKLFPKNKKLKVPDLSAIDFRYMTYLSWIDIATNKLFIVYPFEGQFIGIEGRMTPMNKKGYCLFCNRQQQLAFFTVKTKLAKSSPDDYSSIGQYICIESQACNHRITDTAALERFILSTRA